MANPIGWKSKQRLPGVTDEPSAGLLQPVKDFFTTKPFPKWTPPQEQYQAPMLPQVPQGPAPDANWWQNASQEQRLQWLNKYNQSGQGGQSPDQSGRTAPYPTSPKPQYQSNATGLEIRYNPATVSRNTQAGRTAPVQPVAQSPVQQSDDADINALNAMYKNGAAKDANGHVVEANMTARLGNGQVIRGFSEPYRPVDSVSTSGLPRSSSVQNMQFNPITRRFEVGPNIDTSNRSGGDPMSPYKSLSPAAQARALHGARTVNEQRAFSTGGEQGLKDYRDSVDKMRGMSKMDRADVMRTEIQAASNERINKGEQETRKSIADASVAATNKATDAQSADAQQKNKILMVQARAQRQEAEAAQKRTQIQQQMELAQQNYLTAKSAEDKQKYEADIAKYRIQGSQEYARSMDNASRNMLNEARMRGVMSQKEHAEFRQNADQSWSGAAAKIAEIAANGDAKQLDEFLKDFRAGDDHTGESSLPFTAEEYMSADERTRRVYNAAIKPALYRLMLEKKLGLASE